MKGKQEKGKEKRRKCEKGNWISNNNNDGDGDSDDSDDDGDDGNYNSYKVRW